MASSPSSDSSIAPSEPPCSPARADEFGADLAPGAAGRPRRLLADDRDLLAALRAGDPAAARPFHDRVRPLVDRTTFRLLGARDTEREDVAQTAMIELISTIEQYRGDCSLDSWVSIVSARVVYKHLRRRRLERRIFEGLIEPDEGARPTVQPVMWRSLMRRVMAILHEMDEGRAWAFVLHDVCGYDLRETAQITGVSVAAAQTRLVRGRRELHARVHADAELSDALNKWEGSA